MSNSETGTQSGMTSYGLDDRPLGVLVGFDGSEQARLALHYAARAAQRRNAPLTVVHAFKLPSAIYTTLPAIPEVPEDSATRKAAQETLGQARDYLEEYPGEVTYRAEHGDAAGILVELSSSAHLVVLGGRGRGGFLGRILGSVSSAVPGHAHTPTVVVPKSYAETVKDLDDPFAPMKDEGAPVVVGLDGSKQSRVAALQAAEAADARRSRLHMILTLPPLGDTLEWYPGVGPSDSTSVQRRVNELKKHMEREAEWIRGHFPHLEVTVGVESGTPVGTLALASEKAQLTVVGTRGRGAVASTLMGSTSRGVLLSAQGPVMVVPEMDDERLSDQPTSAL
ncbi:universal stress protein [Nesterenkonia sp. NBAIMH1]|uniref:universal stress protein n=1 Tax=Nesterenkonia sp. NBAIMH1 TaxID=2600320 RepID=UPI001FEF6710|nr:universal stress protein [Nesterenkonia sp. NBAIMH1]